VKKVTLTLTYDALITLENTLKSYLDYNGSLPRTAVNKILQALTAEILIKIHARTLFDTGAKIKIQLTRAQANSLLVSMPGKIEELGIFEQSLMRIMIAEIDKKV